VHGQNKILVCQERRHPKVDQLLLMEFYNHVASEGRNTVSGNCWLKYQGSCKKAEKYTTVIVVLLLWKIFGGVCSEQPWICINGVANFLQYLAHLSNSIYSGWLCKGCCLAVQDKNLFFLWENNKKEPMLAQARGTRNQNNVLSH